MAFMDKSGDWGGRLAPSLAALESLARLAFARLPEKMRLLCRDVAVHFADFPDEAVIEDMGLDSPFELLSLFEGRGVSPLFSFDAEPAEDAAPGGVICLFRRPILDYWAENDETLEEIITYLLVHELSHPFGFNEEEVERAVCII